MQCRWKKEGEKVVHREKSITIKIIFKENAVQSSFEALHKCFHEIIYITLGTTYFKELWLLTVIFFCVLEANGEALAYPPISGLFPVSPFFTFPHSLADLSLAYAPVIEDIRPFLGILAGIVGSIFLVALIIVIVVRVRGSSGRDRNNYSHPGSGVGGVGGVGGTTGNGSGMGGGGGGGGGVGGTTANGNGSLGLLASNNNGSLVIGTLGHNGGQSVQDMHRIGRETCHVTSSLDSIDKNPDIIPQGGLGEFPQVASIITVAELILNAHGAESLFFFFLQTDTTWTMSGRQRDMVALTPRQRWPSKMPW